MTAVQDLIANPRKFMENNIVIVQVEGTNTTRTHNGVSSLILYKRPISMTKGHKRNFFKTDVPVYYLAFDPLPNYIHNATVEPGTIPAYFCPYKEKETHGTTISNGADLMFTTQMDGCSLGIGSAGFNGAGPRLIFHANRGGASNVAVNAQDQSLRQEFQADNARIEKIWAPNDYRESRKGTSYKSTTFGVRDPATNTWRFYAQRYTTEALVPINVFGLKGLFDVL